MKKINKEYFDQKKYIEFHFCVCCYQISCSMISCESIIKLPIFVEIPENKNDSEIIDYVFDNLELEQSCNCKQLGYSFSPNIDGYEGEAKYSNEILNKYAKEYEFFVKKVEKLYPNENKVRFVF
jgi:hypothetical protein